MTGLMSCVCCCVVCVCAPMIGLFFCLLITGLSCSLFKSGGQLGLILGVPEARVNHPDVPVSVLRIQQLRIVMCTGAISLTQSSVSLFHSARFSPKFDANLLNTEKTLITSKCELFLQPEAGPGFSIVGHRALCLFPVLDLLP